MSDELSQWRARVSSFVFEAHEILGAHSEALITRIYTVESINRTLRGLTVKQVDLLRQSIRCVEHGIFRAAHVMCWAAMADFLQETCAADGFNRLRTARPKWKIQDVESLREGYTEFAIIEAMKAADIISRSDMKGLHGLLNRRNECAHPSDVFPDFDQSLGFISENIQRLQAIQKRNSSYLG